MVRFNFFYSYLLKIIYQKLEKLKKSIIKQLLENKNQIFLPKIFFQNKANRQLTLINKKTTRTFQLQLFIYFIL